MSFEIGMVSGSQFGTDVRAKFGSTARKTALYRAVEQPHPLHVIHVGTESS